MYKIIVLFISFLISISTLNAKIHWADELVGFSSQISAPEFGAMQAIGKPNIMSDFGKSKCAWAPSDRGGSDEWIRLGFNEPIHVENIVIHESFNPGLITKILLYDSLNHGYQVFANNVPESRQKHGRLYYLNIPRTDYRVHEIKIQVRLSKYIELYQIDAVGISDSNDIYTIKINEAPDTLKNEPENLGIKINSYARELTPVISADDKSLYFVRNGHSNNIGSENNQDIWYSEKDENGEFKLPINMDFPINNDDNNFIISISPDGNTMILGNKYILGRGTIRGFSKSTKTKSGWSFPDSMHIINYYNLDELGSYNVSSSGKVLLMSLYRKDSYGTQDIYVSFLIEEDIWSEPINIGNTINTAASEITPFLGPDEKSLYFSSAGHPGYGSHDMFVSKRLDDTWKNWSKPVNLGRRLNTAGWDAYYTIPASGNYAYFVSSENSIGNEDIFRIKLHESVKPESVILVSGKVYNAKTNEPIEAKIIYEDLSTGDEFGIARSDPENGSYSIVLPSGKKYGFLAEKKGFVARNENIDLVDLTKYKEIKKDLYLVPIEKGQKVILNNIFFEFGEYELLNESFSELNRIVKILKENENLDIKITGHTDNIGSNVENMQLSKQRAESVANYLKQYGIDSKRLFVTGKGALQPIASNKTEEGRKKNRRVDFEIIKD